MLRDADAGEPRMRHRAPDKRHLAHPRKTKIRDVLSAAMQEAIVFLAAQPDTNPGLAQSSSLRLSAASNAPHNATLAPAPRTQRRFRSLRCIIHDHAAHGVA
jgi:hypothetical protein